MSTPGHAAHIFPAISLIALSLCLPAASLADIILSEVVTDNLTSLADEDGDSPDWIELHNDGPSSVDLAGYFLSDNPGDLNKWELPATQLPPGGYIIVFASGKDRSVTGSPLHTNFQLKNGGEFLALVSPDATTVVDAFDPEIPQLDEDTSFGVQLVDNAWVIHYFDTPTPNAANSGGTVGEEVQFSVPGQPFPIDTPIQLELTSRSGGTIKYTTNGSDPNGASGITYTGPITLDSIAVIHASVAGGPVHQESYFAIDNSISTFTSDLPVVVMQSASTIGTSFRPALVAILEPDPESGRTSFTQNFALSSDAIAKTRGSSSQSFPKKSYRIEFQDALGNGRSLKPLGLPSESDWILSGRYEEDRALVRNEFIFQLSNQIGRYAPRTRFCEVFVHRSTGALTYSRDYVGVYSLTENIKRDADRVDVEELLRTDTTEPTITGGYIFKVDRGGPNDTEITGGGQNVKITEPDRRGLATQQRAYLTNYLNRMVRVLRSSDPETGYPAYIDAGSWVDVHMLNMLMLNVDALRLSAYYHKSREGKISAGPIWDFNISSGSRDRFGSPPRPSEPETWRGISGDRGTTFFTNGTQRWWGDLFRNRDFQQQYCDRWNALRKGPFSTENIHAIIDGMAAQLAEAQPRNQAKWRSVPPEYGGYQGEIDHLKDWLQTRAEWIDVEFVAAPRVEPNGGALAPGAQITLTDHPRAGAAPTTIYYTTDGSDPRLPGGQVNPSATAYTGPFTLASSANLTVREHMPDYRPLPDGPDMEWSAPATVPFVVGVAPAGASNLAVSEIMYHPGNPTQPEIDAGYTNDDLFEFVELTNTSNNPIDLLGLSFTDGIEFQITEPTILQPGGFAVVVTDLDAFNLRYGDNINVIGTYSGRLRNSGETLAVTAGDGSAIASIPYDDDGILWPAEADGVGKSLVFDLSTPGASQSEPGNWAASFSLGGSPGTAEQQPAPEYLAWVDANFSPDNLHLSSPGADPDADGFSNFAEFALKGNPLSADNPGPSISPGTGGATGTILLEFIRNTAVGDVLVSTESSTALGVWQAATPVDTQVTPAGADAEKVVLTFPSPTDSSEVFFRLAIQ